MEDLTEYDIPEFDDYKLIKNGTIVSYKKNTRRVLKGGVDRYGYPMAILCKNGFHYTKYMHRLLAIMFIPNPENKPQVNHINGIKTDCRVENLEWVTDKENKIHSVNNGLFNTLKGTDHYRSKFSESDIVKIRCDNRSIRELAELYKVTYPTIANIRKRYTWKHI